jgi:hypothetical protein
VSSNIGLIKKFTVLSLNKHVERGNNIVGGFYVGDCKLMTVECY